MTSQTLYPVLVGIATGTVIYYWATSSQYPEVNEPELIRSNSRMVEVAGGRLKLRLVQLGSDTPGKPVVVFVHGLGGQVTQFANQLKHYSSRFLCVAADTVGHGKAEKPSTYEEYKTSAIVESLYQVLTTRHADRKFIIVGHSYGTVLTSWLVKQLEDRSAGTVKGVVLIGAVTPMTKESQARIPNFRYVPEAVIDMFRLYDKIGGINSASVRRYIAASAPLAAKQQQLEWNSASRTPTLKRTIAGMDWGAADVFSNLGTTGVPVLMVVGAEDHVTPLAASVKAKELIIGGGKTTVEGPVALEHSSHNTMVDAPDALHKVMDEFLASLKL